MVAVDGKRRQPRRKRTMTDETKPSRRSAPLRGLSEAAEEAAARHRRPEAGDEIPVYIQTPTGFRMEKVVIDEKRHVPAPKLEPGESVLFHVFDELTGEEMKKRYGIE